MQAWDIAATMTSAGYWPPARPTMSPSPTAMIPGNTSPPQSRLPCRNAQGSAGIGIQSHRLDCASELGIVQIVVEALFRKQILMASLLDHPPAVHDQDG